MKAMNLLKSIFVVACIFVANLTISANTPEANLIYNGSEPDLQHRRSGWR